jgi:hypothetical protein
LTESLHGYDASRMAIPRLPALHDLVRLWRPTFQETVAATKAHLLQPPVPVDYRIARSLALAAFSHGLPWNALLRACDAAEIAVERRMNADVTRLIWDLGEARRIRCYSPHDKRLTIPDGRIRLRRDVLVRVVIDFLYVENDQVRYFWAQFRKTFALSEVQLGVMASVFRRTFLVDDDRAADLEIFDMSTPSGGSARCPRVLRLSELPTIPDDSVVDVLQRVVDAYDAVRAKDIDWASARAGRRSPPPTPPGFI